MIYTVTLNPAVDYIVKVSQFETGQLNRSEEDYKFPGGKGINVSRVLKRFGYDSSALGFLGGFTGNYIRTSLEAEEIRTDFTEIDGDTRMNIKLKTLEETEINGRSPQITAQNVDELHDKLRQLQPGDTLVLAGSAPETVPKDLYKSIIIEAKKRDIDCYVDTNGPALRHALEATPFFVKPNHHELAELYDAAVLKLEDVIHYAKKLKEDYGVPHVIVSMASRGALYIGHEVLHLKSPKGKLVNSVGAGDSAVAGFISKWQETGDYVCAAKYAVASGSASAFSTGFCEKEIVDRYSEQITVERLGDA